MLAVAVAAALVYAALDGEGFTVSRADGGDFILRVRRDAARAISIS